MNAMPETSVERATPVPKKGAQNRGLSPLLLLLLLLGAGIAALTARTWALDAGLLEDARRLPKRTRHLLNAASMEPVAVALAARAIALTGEERGSVQPAPADNRITFRVPAAYLAGVSFHNESPYNRDAPGASVLTFLFWNRSFDPVRPDEIADFAACRPGELRPCAAHGPGGGPMVARRRAGEFPLHVRVWNGASSDEHRRYSIRYWAGVARGVNTLRADPCEFREDAALGMLVGRGPEGVFSACNLASSGAVIQGRRFSRATFLKSEADGTPRFGVRCPVFTGPDDGVGPSPCEMLGFFGVWPLSLSVPSDRTADWNYAFERVQAFLARHTVSRSD